MLLHLHSDPPWTPLPNNPPSIRTWPVLKHKNMASVKHKNMASVIVPSKTHASTHLSTNISQVFHISAHHTLYISILVHIYHLQRNCSVHLVWHCQAVVLMCLPGSILCTVFWILPLVPPTLSYRIVWLCACLLTLNCTCQFGFVFSRLCLTTCSTAPVSLSASSVSMTCS